VAVTVDNTIARVSNDGGTAVTTGSFNVAAGAGLVITCNCDESNDLNVTTWTLSDNQTPDLTYVEINRRGGATSGAGAVINYYVANPGAITGLTSTQTVSGSVGADSPSIKVYPVTGHDTADMAGVIGQGDLTADPQTTSAVISETAGAFFAVWTDWNQTGVPTSSDLTVSGFDTAGDISGGSGYKAIASIGESVTGNINSGGAPAGNYTVFEIRAAAGAGTNPKGPLSNPLAGPFGGAI
jgi:hypothetical protein